MDLRGIYMLTGKINKVSGLRSLYTKILHRFQTRPLPNLTPVEILKKKHLLEETNTNHIFRFFTLWTPLSLLTNTGMIENGFCFFTAKRCT